MNEKPLERLNYYNGQRLEANDLKLEQEYFIRVRRWLNKSLYSQGIADGLEVRAVEGLPTVIVSPGLALDVEGREIILLEETPVDVISKEVYLTIQYREETLAEESGYCNPRTDGQAASRLAWGGPSRVRAEPVLSWSDGLPHESSGKVILTRVRLDANCQKVESVEADVRRYVGPASTAKVHQYALEGERSIDANNPGKIYFHIRGRQPNAVTLYLKAEIFSTLYYTEMGKHGHVPSATANVPTKTPNYYEDPSNPDKYKHRHSLASAGTANDKSHEHNVLEVTFAGAHSNAQDRKLQVYDLGPLEVPVYDNILGVLSSPARRVDPGGTPTPFTAKIAGATDHNHVVTGNTDLSIPIKDDHTHNVTPSALMVDSGVTDPTPPAYSAHGGGPLTYVDNLQVSIGKGNTKANHTTAILNQLADADPLDWANKKLGDGTEIHVLKSKGTGPIKLDFLPGVDFVEGEEYYIELSVTSGGGRILYNLYVE